MMITLKITPRRILGNSSLRLSVRFGGLMLLAVLLAAITYSPSAASGNLFRNQASGPDPFATLGTSYSSVLGSHVAPSFGPTGHAAPLLPQAQPETIATYAGDCTTSKSVFVVGDVVCVRVTGVDLNPFFPRHLNWSTSDSTVVQSTDITTDPQTDTLLINATSSVGGNTIDNRGLWQVVVRNPFFFFPEARAAFVVTDPAHPTADLGVTYSFATNSVQTGSQASFAIQVNSYGPNSSASVSLTDAVPVGASFVAFQQLSGPSFNCSTSSGLTTCTLASMDANDIATFIATYQVDSGTEITNTAVISSATTSDLNGLNNSISIDVPVKTGGGSQCTLTCPGSIVAANDPGTGGHIIHSADFQQPTTSGTCGSVSLTANPDPQTNDYFFGIGTSFVTASTESGETCTFTVTITDNENPTINCPADITTFESPQGSGLKAVSFTVDADDNSGSATVTCDHPSGSSFPVGTTLVTCTATDSSNNSSPSCTFNVTVNPVNTTCVLTAQSPIVTDSDANACGTHVTYTPPVSDGSGTCGTITCDHPSGSFFGVGVTVVTCTSTPDGASTTFTVTVNDTTAPVPDLASLPTITGDCSANAGVPVIVGGHTVFEPPTATDNCGGKLQGATNDPRVYTTAGTFIVHWTYTDVSGNSSSQDQTIIVNGTDTNAPVPDLATLPTVTDECSATVTTVPTATDDCDGTITGTTVDPLTFTGAGTYTVHWIYTDLAGHVVHQNQTVIVTDTHAPTIALVGSSSITVECHTSFSDPGVTTTDNCVPKNVTVTTSGSVNVNVPNTYVITYTATDGGGNQAAVQRTVIVSDTIAPVVTAPPNITVYTGSGATTCGATVSNAVLGTASALDSCQGSIPTSRVPAGNVFPVGQTVVTYSATDISGNTGMATQTVTVIDNTPPTISCAADIVADFDPAVNGAVVTYTVPVGTDNCPGATTTQIAGLASGATFPVGTTTNTFRVTDAAGLTATCSFKVTVALTSIIGLDSVSITGSGYADSYSSIGGYPASKGSLANILSNGTITMGNSGKVWGNVRSTRAGVSMSGASEVTGNATAGTTVTKSGSATVGGTITNNALAPSMSLPAVTACGPPYSTNSGITGTYTYNAGTGDLSLSGVNIATLANGTYCFHNVTLTNSAQLKVNGPVVIRITGTFSASGATVVNNTTAIPGNLRLLSSYTGSNGLSLTNGTSIHMLIYAPNTGVTVSGSAPLFGTVVGKTVTISNSGAIHYDTELKSVWPDVWALIVGP